MEKEENPKSEKINTDHKGDGSDAHEDNVQNLENEKNDNVEDIKKLPEEKILDLEDKLARTFAEMENQRRRFEKEKEEAFEYGGYSFAKEALNLIDNLERSKQILETDEKLKDTEALIFLCFQFLSFLLSSL